MVVFTLRPHYASQPSVTVLPASRFSVTTYSNECYPRGLSLHVLANLTPGLKTPTANTSG